MINLLDDFILVSSTQQKVEWRLTNFSHKVPLYAVFQAQGRGSIITNVNHSNKLNSL
jgi:hypothetical protein